MNQKKRSNRKTGLKFGRLKIPLKDSENEVLRLICLPSLGIVPSFSQLRRDQFQSTHSVGFANVNSRKSVRWSAVPVAPVFVYVSVMVRGAAAPKGPMTYAQ